MNSARPALDALPAGYDSYSFTIYPAPYTVWMSGLSASSRGSALFTHQLVCQNGVIALATSLSTVAYERLQFALGHF